MRRGVPAFTSRSMRTSRTSRSASCSSLLGVPDGVLPAMACLVTNPDARVAEAIRDFVELRSLPSHVLEPARNVARDHMVVFTDHLDTLLAREHAVADIAARMIGRASVPELHVLHVVVNAVVVDVVQVRIAAVRAIER